jgi:PDZ domain-containing protein
LYYYSGMALAFLLVVAGELIWLPDPLRFANGKYWIDMLDLLFYSTALIPFCWLVGSLRRKAHRKRQMSSMPNGNPSTRSHLNGFQIRKWVVITTSTISCVLILTIPKELYYSASALIISWIVVFVDLWFLERAKRKIPVQTISVMMGTICLLGCLFWPTNYMVTYPGITMNMNQYAQAHKGQIQGEISGVLVFERPAFPIDWLYAKLFPHYSFKLEQLDMSLGEYNEQVRIMKVDANAAGSSIAFQKLGKGEGITSQGVLISAINQDSPIKGILQLGDRIEQVGEKPVKNLQQLTAQMTAIKPGDKVKITVRRQSELLTITASTLVHPDDPKRAAFGIQVSNDFQFDIPETVRFHNYALHEGGPSHGAMLALAIIDQLTPGGITHGNKVAGTGTVEVDGLIGPVGGVEQKAYTVSRTDADVFFVPTANESEARKGARGLEVVPVHSIDDILNWLKANPK